jgi:hypothetical protein
VARANTNKKINNNNNNAKQRPTRKPVIERQESEKGDMFFKIVIIVLLIGIFAVLIWFVIDFFINRDEVEDPDFHAQQWVLFSDIQAMYDGGDAHINNRFLREAFTDQSILSIYIFIFDVEYDQLDEDNLRRTNTAAAMVELNRLFDYGHRVDDEDRDDYRFVSFDSIAIFLMDVNNAMNDGWQQFVTGLLDEDGRPFNANWPTLLSIDFDTHGASAEFTAYNNSSNDTRAIVRIIYIINTHFGGEEEE